MWINFQKPFGFSEFGSQLLQAHLLFEGSILLKGSASVDALEGCGPGLHPPTALLPLLQVRHRHQPNPCSHRPVRRTSQVPPSKPLQGTPNLQKFCLDDIIFWAERCSAHVAISLSCRVVEDEEWSNVLCTDASKYTGQNMANPGPSIFFPYPFSSGDWCSCLHAFPLVSTHSAFMCSYFNPISPTI